MSFLQHLRHVLLSKIQKSTCVFYIQVTTTSYTEGGVRDKSALYNAQKSTQKVLLFRYLSLSKKLKLSFFEIYSNRATSFC